MVTSLINENGRLYWRSFSRTHVVHSWQWRHPRRPGSVGFSCYCRWGTGWTFGPSETTWKAGWARPGQSTGQVLVYSCGLFHGAFFLTLFQDDTSRRNSSSNSTNSSWMQGRGRNGGLFPWEQPIRDGSGSKWWTLRSRRSTSTNLSTQYCYLDWSVNTHQWWMWGCGTEGCFASVATRQQGYGVWSETAGWWTLAWGQGTRVVSAWWHLFSDGLKWQANETQRVVIGTTQMFTERRLVTFVPLWQFFALRLTLLKVRHHPVGHLANDVLPVLWLPFVVRLCAPTTILPLCQVLKHTLMQQKALYMW